MAEERAPLLNQNPFLDESGEDSSNYQSLAIPTYDNLTQHYQQRWAKEKEKFQTQLKCNFFALVERFAAGKQELFMLTCPQRKENLYTQAFLDLCKSQYAPHVGDVERLAGKRTRRLYVTLPNNYN